MWYNVYVNTKERIMVRGIGTNLLLGYINYASKNSSSEDLFRQFSTSIGGDGNTISKNNLDSYIQSAENGTVKASSTKIDAMKNLSDNWENFFGDSKSVSIDEFQEKIGVFASVLLADSKEEVKETAKTAIEDTKKIREAEAEKKAEAQKKIQEQQKELEEQKKQIQEFYNELSTKVEAAKDGITKNDLTNYLNKLLDKADAKSNTTNSDEIDFISNLIGDFNVLANGTDKITEFKILSEYDDVQTIPQEEFEGSVDLKII